MGQISSVIYNVYWIKKDKQAKILFIYTGLPTKDENEKTTENPKNMTI